MRLRLVLGTILASFLGGSATIYSTVMNVPQNLIESFVKNSFQSHYGVKLDNSSTVLLWSAVQSSLDVGGLLGSLLVFFSLERFGRRDTCLILNQILTISAAAFQFLARPFLAFELLIIGRFLAGVAEAIGTGALPIFFTESAPNSIRGQIGSLSTFFAYSWVILGPALGLPEVMGNQKLWPYLLGLSIIPAVLAMLLRFVLPESPKYLFIKQKEPVAAISSILSYHGSSADVEEVVREFRAEDELARDQPDLPLLEIFKSPVLRRSLFIGIMGLVSLDVLGADAIGQYSTSFFQSVGVDLITAGRISVFARIPEFVLSILAIPFFDRWGRRPMMLLGLAIGFLGETLVVIGGVLSLPVCSLLGMMLIYAIQRITISPLGHFLVAEVCPQATRSKTASIGLFFNWIGSFLIVLTYPTIQARLGWLAFLLFNGWTLLFFIWFWWFLPETKNRSVEDIVSHIDETKRIFPTEKEEYEPLDQWNKPEYGTRISADNKIY